MIFPRGSRKSTEPGDGGLGFELQPHTSSPWAEKRKKSGQHSDFISWVWNPNPSTLYNSLGRSYMRQRLKNPACTLNLQDVMCQLHLNKDGGGWRVENLYSVVRHWQRPWESRRWQGQDPQAGRASPGASDVGSYFVIFFKEKISSLRYCLCSSWIVPRSML